MPTTPKDSPKDRGTELAEERTFLAAERTLMAWMRTSLSMISFGFTVAKLFDYLDKLRGPTVGLLGRTWTPQAVGFSMMVIGTGSLILAVFQHRKTLKSLRAGGMGKDWSLALLVSSLVAMLGLFALASLALGH